MHIYIYIYTKKIVEEDEGGEGGLNNITRYILCVCVSIKLVFQVVE